MELYLKFKSKNKRALGLTMPHIITDRKGNKISKLRKVHDL